MKRIQVIGRAYESAVVPRAGAWIETDWRCDL